METKSEISNKSGLSPAYRQAGMGPTFLSTPKAGFYGVLIFNILKNLNSPDYESGASCPNVPNGTGGQPVPKNQKSSISLFSEDPRFENEIRDFE